MASDDDVAVRFRVALAVSAMGGDAETSILASILRRDPDDSWIRAAVFAGAGRSSVALLGVLLKDDRFITHPDSPGAVKQLVGSVAGTGSTESLRAVLDAAREVRGPSGPKLRMSVVVGIAAGLERIGSSLRSMRDSEVDNNLLKSIDGVLAEAPPPIVLTFARDCLARFSSNRHFSSIFPSLSA